MFMKKTAFLATAAICASTFISCGGDSSTSTPPHQVNAQAQGVYEGSSTVNGSESGLQFIALVLPNDDLYTVYIDGSNPPESFLSGMISGTATESGSNLTASIHDFHNDDTISTGSFSGSFVAGASITGTLTESGTSTDVTLNAVPSAEFNYNTAAHLSDISDTWGGFLLDGEVANFTVDANGNINGATSAECTFIGTATPDTSGKNFFNVKIIFGPSPCIDAGKSIAGAGIVVIAAESSPVQKQMLVGLKASDNTFGTTLFASNGSIPTRTSQIPFLK